MVKTVEVTGAVTRTVHDGTNMIVLHEGRKVPVSETSLPYLRQRKLIREGKAKASLEQQAPANPGEGSGEGTDLDALMALAVEAGYTVAETGNGWHTITGGSIPADEPEKVRGDDDLAAKLTELVDAGGADAPPA